MAGVISKDLVGLISDGLEFNLRKQVAEKLEQDLIESFRASMEPYIRDAVSAVVIGNVEHVRSMLELKDIICVDINFEGEVYNGRN